MRIHDNELSQVTDAERATLAKLGFAHVMWQGTEVFVYRIHSILAWVLKKDFQGDWVGYTYRSSESKLLDVLIYQTFGDCGGLISACLLLRERKIKVLNSSLTNLGYDYEVERDREWFKLYDTFCHPDGD